MARILQEKEEEKMIYDHFSSIFPFIIENSLPFQAYMIR
jgi:hypothetical protein